MGIYEKDLWGRTKHGLAVERIRSFCAGKRTLVAFSGGKDSQCCYHLAEEAGIDFQAQYSVTRFEPPGLIDFVKRHYPAVTFRRAYEMSLIDEIAYRGLPSRWARWCCAAKHARTEGFDIAVIGVRWAESAARRDSWRMFGLKPDRTAYLCPIVEWTEADVWEYLGGRPHCPLYDEGMKRIGCVMCPLSPQSMKEQAERFPKTAAVLRKGAEAYVRRAAARGFVTMKGKPFPDWCRAADPAGEYWRRWVETGQTAKPDLCAAEADGQMCLFAGTGFDERDGGGREEL